MNYRELELKVVGEPGSILSLSIANGLVHVGQIQLDETFLPDAFEAFHGAAGIGIDVDQRSRHAGKIVFRGQTSFRELENPRPGLANPLIAGPTRVVVTIELLGQGQLCVGLRFPLAETWRFSTSFPELAPVDDDDSQPLSLDGFKFTNCFLCLQTHAGKTSLDDGAEVALEQGLSFVGHWQPEGLPGWLEHPVNGVLLRGPVILDAAGPLGKVADDRLPWDDRHRIPGVHLQGDLPSEIWLPPHAEQGLRVRQMAVRIYTPLVWSQGFDSADLGPSMAFFGDLVVPGENGGRLAKVITTTDIGSADRLVLTSRFDALTPDSLLLALRRLAGGEDAGRVLPGDAGHAADAVGLRSASIELERKPDGAYEVGSTSLVFGFAEGTSTWPRPGEPFSDLIGIKFHAATVTVVKPFDSEHRAVFAEVRGSTEFLGGKAGQGLKLAVTATYPEFRITATQQGTTTVNLIRFRDQGLKLPDFLNFELEIAAVAFVAEPGVYCAFSMNLAPGPTWRIGRYVLPRLSLSVSCVAEGGRTALGWQLKASSGEGDAAVPVVELVERLGSAVAGFQFEVAALPSAIRGLTVTDVDIGYGAGEKRLTFECRGTLPLSNGRKLDCGFTIDKGNAAQTSLGGWLRFQPPGAHPISFDLIFGASGNTGGALAGLVTANFSLRQVIAGLSEWLNLTEVPDIPDFLNVEMEALFLYVDLGTTDLLLGGTTALGSKAAVVFSGNAKDDRKWAVLVEQALHIGLSSLPLVSDKIIEVAGQISGVEDLGIESLQAVVSFGVRDEKRDIGLLNGVIGAAQQMLDVVTLPRLPEPRPASAGTLKVVSGDLRMHLGVTYYLADKPQPALPFAYDGATEQERLVPAAGSLASGRNITQARSQAVWFDVQRSFGPVSVRRLGIACIKGEVRLLLDAAVVLSGMTMELQGLSLAMPIDAIFKFDRRHILDALRSNVDRMSTSLDGLSLSFESGPLSVSGGLLSVTPPPANTRFAYDGTLQIKADRWAVSAVGSFAELVGGGSSLFAFGYLNAILGGPAFFFVTGVAAGFGYNRNLTLPSLETLPSFPLIAACTATSEQARQIQNDIGDYLYPAPGRHWIAAGVRFTSFRLIDSFALFTVIFGERFEIALLGLATLTLPAPPKPGTKPKEGARPYASIARAQLALEATYAPDEGVLRIAAQLTPESYILSKDCQLTGGFALYTWFQDEYLRDPQGHPTTTLARGGSRAGDFVLSIGGYHPEFKPPSHFPLVPRVEANWRVNEKLSIKGSLYFALTPLAIMAGGTLDANYESANFKAWFNTRVDFLICWEPLAYQATQKLILGVSYTIDWWYTAKPIKVEIGVDLELYGPPFGGRAVVDLYVCSFTIDLGPRPEAPLKLDWSEFEDRLLPKPAPEREDQPAVCLARAAGGLIREIASQKSHEPATWVVNPEKFVVVTSSAIPCSVAPSVNGVSATTNVAIQQFAVRPCELLNGRLKSEHVVEWLDDAGQVADAWDIEPLTERLPAALWGAVDLPPTQRKAMSVNDFRGEQLTMALVTGCKLTPRQRPLTHRTAPIKLSQLPMTARSISIAEADWTEPTFAKAGTYALENRDEAQRYGRLGGVSGADLVQKRQALRAALARQEIGISGKPTTRYLADAARNHELHAAPPLWALGEVRPS